MEFNEFARNLTGVALFALQEWEFIDSGKPVTDEAMHVRFGRMTAYGSILELITGSHPRENLERVKAVIAAM
jgi:hypothetical protein